MKTYSGPCYTLQEVADILELTPSAVSHHIRRGELAALVYTKKRKMLVFSQQDGQHHGRGVCVYQGHLALSERHIDTLLDGDPVVLGTDYGYLLDPGGILDYVVSYPFHRTTSDEWFYGWRPRDQDTLDLATVNAMPLPEERETVQSQVLGIINPVLHSNPDAYKLFIEQPAFADKAPERAYRLDYTQSTFAPDALRVPHSDIERFQRQRHVDAITQPSLADGQQRENQLHTLIKRILKDEPDMGAKAIWKLIQHDCDADDPEFDTDHILLCVDEDCIEWRSRGGTDQSLTWTSFQSLISKLRKVRKPVKAP